MLDVMSACTVNSDMCWWCSYGGMLSAYMRFRYPNIITGSIAASAPIFLVAGDSPRDTFFEDVTAVCTHFCTCLTYDGTSAMNS